MIGLRYCTALFIRHAGGVRNISNKTLHVPKNVGEAFVKELRGHKEIVLPWKPEFIDYAKLRTAEILQSEAQRGCADSAELIAASTEFKKSQLDVLYIKNVPCFPELSKDSLQNLPKIILQDDYSNRDTKMRGSDQDIIKHFPGMVLSLGYGGMCGLEPYKNLVNRTLPVSSMFIIDGFGEQNAHRDDVPVITDKAVYDIEGLSIHALNSRGTMGTYFIGAQEIYDKLSDQAKSTLQQKIFYSSSYIKGKDKQILNRGESNLFSIIYEKNGRIGIRWDSDRYADGNIIALDKAGKVSKEESAKAMNELFDVTVKLIDSKQIYCAVLKGGEMVLANHEHSLHGRICTANVGYGANDSERKAIGTLMSAAPESQVKNSSAIPVESNNKNHGRSK